MIINPSTITGTTVAGTLSANSQNYSGGLLRNVLVKPTTASTTYDITITNSQSIVIYERTSETGTLSEEVSLPVRGIYTVTIANATANEAFTIQLMIQE